MQRSIFNPKFSRKTRYAYAVGRIRGLEKKLLNKQQLERLIEAETVTEFVNELNETTYKRYIQVLNRKTEFENLLTEILRDFMEELGKLIQDPGISYALALPYDVHNLKLILKKYLAGEKFDQRNYIELGNYSTETLELLLKDKKLDEYPEHFRIPVEFVIEDFANSENIGIVDTVIDKILYQEWMRLGSQLGLEYLVNLARLSIDMANFGILLRIKGFNRNTGLLRTALIENGFFPLDYLIDLAEEDFEVIWKALGEDPYKKPFAGIPDNLSVIEKIEQFETNSRAFILEYCHLADFISFGVEPLIALYMKKNEEIRILRTIFLARKNNFTKDQIKKLL